MDHTLSKFEDRIRKEKENGKKENRYSKYCDFIYYKSSVNPELTLAMRVLKPEKPSYIVASTHGWHMSISDFQEYDKPVSDYLLVEVDMRGRAFSDGTPDCSGWELYDVIDAVEYVKENYKEYLLSTSIVYFEAGSGGGGNAYAIAGKFPDYFAAIVSMCGMSDYLLWHKNDAVGEFRDELDVWVGSSENEQAYHSRSGITMVENLCAPMAIIHGMNDIRVPVYHARHYVEKAKKCNKEELIQFWEVPDVGGKDHWTDGTPEFFCELTQYRKAFINSQRQPVRIPPKGEMVVCGYLFTKEFAVVLDSIDHIATVRYDLTRDHISVLGAAEGTYRIYKK